LDSASGLGNNTGWIAQRPLWGAVSYGRPMAEVSGHRKQMREFSAKADFIPVG
jgi:hypothetical protein